VISSISNISRAHTRCIALDFGAIDAVRRPQEFLHAASPPAMYVPSGKDNREYWRYNAK
jgi:hypothetical protein